MSNHLQSGEPSWYVTSHPGQLSLAILLWVGTMSTSKSCVSKQVQYPHNRGFTAYAGVWLMAKEMEIGIDHY